MTSEKLPMLPVGYRILVKQDLVEEKSTSGIIVRTNEQVEREQSGNHTGVVMAVGPQCYDKMPDVWCKVGDRIMFPNYAGKKFRVSELKNVVDTKDRQYWHIMNDEDVLGVIPNE